MGKASRDKRNRPATKIKKQRNLFPIVTSLGVVVVVAIIAAFFVVGTKASHAPAQSPASSSVNQSTGAITVGKGKTVLDEYLDFGCPHCNAWFDKSHKTVEDLVKRDLVTLNIHPISILDNSFQGTKYSTRSASAAYCVADTNPEVTYSFVSALFKDQPEEGTKGLTDKKLVALAKSVGAEKAASCITSGKYEDFVAARTKQTPIQEGAGGISTPTLQLDGQFFSPSANVADIKQIAESKK